MPSIKLELKLKETYIFPLLAFLLPLLVRAIPEALMGPFAVGFDPLGYYVPYTLSWLRNGVSFWAFLGAAPLFYLLLGCAVSLGVPIIMSIKVISPLFLGFLGVVIYFYANKTLLWSFRKSLLVAIFSTLYFVALRVSFDLLRSELALIFLFIAMIFLKKTSISFRNGSLLSLFMFLVVLSNQIIAVIMFVIVIASIIRLYVDKNFNRLHRTVICSVPAVFIFFVVAYAGLVSSQFSLASNIFGGEIGGSMASTALFGFTSYTDLLVNTLGFLGYCYLPLAPLIVLGARRFKGNIQLKVWILWIFISLILALISPYVFFAVLPYRWTLLLIYPLAFYAVEAFSSLKLNWHDVSLGLSMGLILVTLSIGFLFSSSSSPFPYYTLYPLYVPTSMLQNTVPLSDCQDTIDALQWAQNNMTNSSCLLVHTAFYGWALLTFRTNQLIHYGYGNPETTAITHENRSASQLYLIWWINASGWYGQPTVSSSFCEVYRSGRIAIYQYQPVGNYSVLHSEDLEIGNYQAFQKWYIW